MTKKLTALTIEQMKPKDARYEVGDGAVLGLRLVVQPSGSKSWCLRYRHGGKAHKLTFPGFPSLPVARELARKSLDQLARGANPAAERRAGEGNLFSAVAEEYLKRHAHAKTRASSAAATERLLRVEVLPSWGDKPIQQITKRDVLSLIGGIADRGAPVVANRTLAAIKTLFSWAIGRDILAASPALNVKRPHAETSRSRILDDGEVRKFWLACDQLGTAFGDAAKLMLLTGQRRGEVCGMTWAELDLDKRTWTLPATRTKNGREHVVPLSDAAMSIIEKQPRSTAHVFNSPLSGWSRPKRALDAAMGVEGWTLHDLRRTAATGMHEIGVAPHVVEAVLNHQSGHRAGIAGVYNHAVYANEKRAALAAWAETVRALVEGRERPSVKRRLVTLWSSSMGLGNDG